MSLHQKLLRRSHGCVPCCMRLNSLNHQLPLCYVIILVVSPFLKILLTIQKSNILTSGSILFVNKFPEDNSNYTMSNPSIILPISPPKLYHANTSNAYEHASVYSEE
jgi:hypothetical protein